MTLGEVIVALWVYCLALVVCFDSVQTAFLGMERVESTEGAMYLCQSELDTACRTIALGEQLTPVQVETVNGTSYTLTVQSVPWQPRVLNVKVVISYETIGGHHSLSCDTLEAI